MTKSIKVAIVGATGIVGRELITILEERKGKISSLQLFGSANSCGEKLSFRDDEYVVEELKDADQIDADVAFFAVDARVSKKYIEALAQRGVVCIDKSSAFRMNDDVPLVVPEVNGFILKEKKHQIIASPNCVATPLCQALAPIHEFAGLEQVVVSTYQAVSGAGKDGSDELENQVRDLFNMREVKTDVFGKRIAFNVLPFIPARGDLDDQGKTDEEKKVIEETKKILGLKDLKMDATCVRVPVFNGHSMAVHVATKKALEINDAINIFSQAPGIMVIDDRVEKTYPSSIDACGEDVTLLGRIRPNTAAKNGITFFLSSDNLRTGAALNAVRITEKIFLE